MNGEFIAVHDESMIKQSQTVSNNNSSMISKSGEFSQSSSPSLKPIKKEISQIDHKELEEAKNKAGFSSDHSFQSSLRLPQTQRTTSNTSEIGAPLNFLDLEEEKTGSRKRMRKEIEVICLDSDSEEEKATNPSQPANSGTENATIQSQPANSGVSRGSLQPISSNFRSLICADTTLPPLPQLQQNSDAQKPQEKQQTQPHPFPIQNQLQIQHIRTPERKEFNSTAVSKSLPTPFEGGSTQNPDTTTQPMLDERSNSNIPDGTQHQAKRPKLHSSQNESNKSDTIEIIEITSQPSSTQKSQSSDMVIHDSSNSNSGKSPEGVLRSNDTPANENPFIGSPNILGSLVPSQSQSQSQTIPNLNPPPQPLRNANVQPPFSTGKEGIRLPPILLDRTPPPRQKDNSEKVKAQVKDLSSVMTQRRMINKKQVSLIIVL